MFLAVKLWRRKQQGEDKNGRGTSLCVLNLFRRVPQEDPFLALAFAVLAFAGSLALSLASASTCIALALAFPLHLRQPCLALALAPFTFNCPVAYGYLNEGLMVAPF
jgi:hypothetical protein